MTPEEKELVDSVLARDEALFRAGFGGLAKDYGDVPSIDPTHIRLARSIVELRRSRDGK